MNTFVKSSMQTNLVKSQLLFAKGVKVEAEMVMVGIEALCEMIEVLKKDKTMLQSSCI